MNSSTVTRGRHRLSEDEEGGERDVHVMYARIKAGFMMPFAGRSYVGKHRRGDARREVARTELAVERALTMHGPGFSALLQAVQAA